MKPLIVGELNPFDGDPRYALFPYALSSSGSRLCAILGLCERDYLRRFDRANLCVGTWDTAAARVVARRILKQRRRVLVLLGEKVATAFFGEFEPFSVGRLLGYAHRHATASERAQPYVERGERCQQSAAGSAHRGRAVTLDILCLLGHGSQCGNRAPDTNEQRLVSQLRSGLAYGGQAVSRHRNVYLHWASDRASARLCLRGVCA